MYVTKLYLIDVAYKGIWEHVLRLGSLKLILISNTWKGKTLIRLSNSSFLISHVVNVHFHATTILWKIYDLDHCHLKSSVLLWCLYYKKPESPSRFVGQDVRLSKIFTYWFLYIVLWLIITIWGFWTFWISLNSFFKFSQSIHIPRRQRLVIIFTW